MTAIIWLGAPSVHLTGDVEEYANQRDRLVARALAHDGVELGAHPGQFAVEDAGAVRTSAGGPYTGWRRGRVSSLHDLGLRQEVDEPAPRGGRGTQAKAPGSYVLAG
jgi:deoxyribodipyrimidine photolyase